MNKKRLSLFIKIALSSILLGMLFYKTDVNKFYNIIKGADAMIFLFALVLYLIAQTISTYRWKLLLHAERMNISFYNLISYYYIGMFFNLFMPTLVGGDVIRGYYLYKKSQKSGESVASILVERMSGFFALITIGLLSLIIGYSYIKDEPAITGLLLVIIIGFYASITVVMNKRVRESVKGLMKSKRLAKIQEKIKNISEATKRYRNHKKVVINVILLSFFVQILGITIVYFLSRSLSFNVSLVYFFLFIPIVIVISMVPVTLGGLGVREFVFIFLFHKVGLETAEALSLSLLWFLLITISSLIGGLFFLLTEHPVYENA